MPLLPRWVLVAGPRCPAQPDQWRYYTCRTQIAGAMNVLSIANARKNPKLKGNFFRVCTFMTINKLGAPLIHKTELERAFDLAKSGDQPDVASVIRQLKSEGYSGSQIEGKALKMQIALLIEDAIRTGK
jgi:hypothetical protein